MKIGILTFHRSVNNGAVMQCYSLSKKLKEMFPQDTIEVIDYNMPITKDQDAISFKRFITGRNPIVTVVKFVKFLMDPKSYFFYIKRKSVFANIGNKLPLSKEKIYENQANNLFKYIDDNYDIVIVGSDAIWNYNLRGFPNPYFLDTSLKVKKLTYAASCFGMNYENIPSNEKEQIRKVLNSYSFLGTRDKESEKFVKFLGCSVLPQHTCDPTVFLDVNDLPIDVSVLERKLAERGFDFDKPTIGIMGSNNMLSMVRALYGTEYQIVSLYNYIKGADVNLFDLEPYEWAYVFRYFKLTFTTFFHGTLLSLRNGVPLICIDLNTEFGKRHTPKTLDVLRRLGFEDWYFSTDYKSKNFDKIKAKADELIAGDYYDKIISAMDKEAESFETFNSALKSLLGKER